jgi:outer membrane protein
LIANKFMKTILLCILLSVSIIQHSKAQQQDSTAVVWGLKECVDYALSSNLTLARGENAVKLAEQDYRQSLYSTLPTLNGGVQYGWNWGRSLNPVTYEYTNQELNSVNPFLNSQFNLFNGLRTQYTIKQNQHWLLASEQDLAKTKNDVMLNITVLYLNVILNREQLENARFQFESSKTQLERVKKQVAAGSLARSEELNLDAQVATNETNMIQRENAVNLTLLQLKQALQIPASQSFDIVEIEVSVEDLLIENSRDEIYQIARQTMPEIKSAQLKVKSSEFAVKAARGNYYPRLGVSASMNSNYSSASDGEHFISDGGSPTQAPQEIGFVEGTNQKVYRMVTIPSGTLESSWGKRDQLEDNIYKSLGIQLSIPIFNGMQTRTSVQRSLISKQNTIIAEKEAQNTLREGVENAYNNALAAAKTYNASLRLVTAREEAFRMMTQRYNAGSANSFEYQVSQNDYFQAQSDLTRAKYDFIFRKKLLDFYLGKPLGY